MTPKRGNGAAPVYARVVVDLEPRHLDRPFDYVVPDDLVGSCGVGARVEVVFAGRRRLGLVVGTGSDTAFDASRVRPIRRVLGDHRWVGPEELTLLEWAATRWASPLAHVVRHALPKRVVAVEAAAAEAGWYLAHGPAPAAASPTPLPVEWRPYGGPGLLDDLAVGRSRLHWWWPTADEDVAQRTLELAHAVLDMGRSVLLLTPGPTSAIGDALAGIDGAIDVRTAKERALYRGWLEARHGRARVLVGQRAVAFWPASELGLVVVEDEASPSHKEQRSPRHHVREVALERARRADAICLLTGMIPSAALRGLLAARRITPLRSSRDHERAAAPAVMLLGDDAVPTRLPSRAVKALRAATEAGRYGIVFASQRGEGSALTCTNDRTMARCERCEALLARTSDRTGRLECPRCQHRTRTAWRCPTCGAAELTVLSAGAERLRDELQRSLGVEVAALEGYAPQAPPPPAVLVMTRGSVTNAAPGPVGAAVLSDLQRLA
ncbi:MAG: hypothetical protein R3249_04875, partial [Nitriliruptorales bacterium]|nr:hypothetical protein [Nitriliruptorales bacterium]